MSDCSRTELLEAKAIHRLAASCAQGEWDRHEPGVTLSPSEETQQEPVQNVEHRQMADWQILHLLGPMSEKEAIVLIATGNSWPSLLRCWLSDAT